MPRKCALFVHGIGPQDVGYSIPLWQRLWENRGPDGAHRYELFYYDIFKQMNAKVEADKFVRKYGLTGMLANLVGSSALAGKVSDTLTTTLRDTVSHVLFFALHVDARNAIVNRFRKQLLGIYGDAKAAGIRPRDVKLTIVSHSLGTAVAYLGMHNILVNQALGLSAGIRAKNLFTLASPLALIHEVASRVGLSIRYLSTGIRKPTRGNRTNIGSWYSYRHERDPVASLVPLSGTFLKHRDEPPYLFNQVHVKSTHAFSNYIIQSRKEIGDLIGDL